MAAKRSCPCFPDTEEPKAVPLSTANVATTLTPADQLWCTSSDNAVRLRMEGSGPASETPITIHQMFLETVEKYGDHPALASKQEGQWVTMTWRQYYEQCRAAAKSFLKVCLQSDLFCKSILLLLRKCLGSNTIVCLSATLPGGVMFSGCTFKTNWNKKCCKLLIILYINYFPSLMCE